MIEVEVAALNITCFLANPALMKVWRSKGLLQGVQRFQGMSSFIIFVEYLSFIAIKLMKGGRFGNMDGLNCWILFPPLSSSSTIFLDGIIVAASRVKNELEPLQFLGRALVTADSDDIAVAPPTLLGHNKIFLTQQIFPQLSPGKTCWNSRTLSPN